MGFLLSSVYSWLSLAGRNIFSCGAGVCGIRPYFPDCGAYWVLVLRG